MGGGHSSHCEPDWHAIEQARRAAEEAERARLEAEEQQRYAQEVARQAREAAEHAAREAEAQRQREREAQLAAERAAQAAREEAERIHREREEAMRAARIAMEQEEARARQERERQERMARELEEERRRIRAAEEAARLAAIAAQEEEARRQRAREEEMRKAREAQAAAEEAARRAVEEARKAKEQQEEVERQLKEGTQPVVMPTEDELRVAKAKVQHKDGVFHCAVAGVAGSGKSSLINAFCGVNNQDPNAAPTGVTETTLEVGRYSDPNYGDRFAWYDVPGSGTLKIPDWQYFNSQGLYVFDCIVVLFNNRFTMTDQAILTNCRRFKIPTFIVRSKADQHIRNLMKDMGYDSDDDAQGRREELYKATWEQFVTETRLSVKQNLAEAKLPDQRVYIISNKALLGIVKDRSPRKLIDEVELLTDLYGEAHRSGKFPFGTPNTAFMSARTAKEEAERQLKEGIQPVVTPSPGELAAAKKKVQYKEGLFHFAVAGVAGSGKSSLINAFRGLRNKDSGAAATGVTETTLLLTRYPDANPEYPFVWYDIPGAGTLKIPDWQYFNLQGLYVFDCIIVLFDNRFTMTDIAILNNCKRFKIPTYIVRSKADQHIRNLMRDMGYDSDGSDEEDIERRNRLYKAARKQFVQETKKSVKTNLENANMPDQRVYIISNDTMQGIVKEKTPKKTIDELELLTDLFNEAHLRRTAQVAQKHTAGAGPSSGSMY
ncbi:P-loop containing nucleoside triphosphate hydrolase protein [Gyrodon lividus]|nr:P-loop containing nucleoside triphosphate hydrolase protein [Gyrodon lividus]